MVPVIEIVLVETEGQAIFVSKLLFFGGSVPYILVLSWETIFTTQFCHCNIFIYVTIGQHQILIYDDNIMMQSSFNIEQELFVIYILFGNSFPLLVVDSSINVLMHDRNDLSLLYCKFWLTWTWWMFTILLLLMLFLCLIFLCFIWLEWSCYQGWEVPQANERAEEQGQEDPWCQEGELFIYLSWYFWPADPFAIVLL
jgi:hypothetical protein